MPGVPWFSGSPVPRQSEQLDNTTWIVKRQLPSREFKVVVIPVIERLPDDPEWENVEEAFARHASKNRPEPEE